MCLSENQEFANTNWYLVYYFAGGSNKCGGMDLVERGSECDLGSLYEIINKSFMLEKETF